MLTRFGWLFALAACFITIASVEGWAGPEEDVKSAYTAWDEAFAKGDAKAIAAFYSEDALLLPPSHDVINGPSGVERFFSGIFSMGVSDHKLELIRADGADKVTYGAAKWSAKGKDAQGNDQPWGGVATHVFERQSDGSLKIKLHTFN